MVLLILLHYYWQQFLAQLIKSLDRGLCAIIISSLFKTVVIEQAELNRL